MSESHETHGEMRLSVRESRLVLERILLLTGLPQGYVPAVRDCVLYSQAMKLGGFALLADSFDALSAADTRAWSWSAGRFDGGGQHAWVVAPTLLDLAIERGEVAFGNIAAAAELAVLIGLARRQGAEARVDGARVTATAGSGADPVLEAARRDGLTVPGPLWWRLYHLSNRSLSPDSVQSRRHAGPVIVEADGRVIGRRDLDDETDLTMLGLSEEQAAAQRAATERNSSHAD